MCNQNVIAISQDPEITVIGFPSHVLLPCLWTQENKAIVIGIALYCTTVWLSQTVFVAVGALSSKHNRNQHEERSEDVSNWNSRSVTCSTIRLLDAERWVVEQTAFEVLISHALSASVRVKTHVNDAC